MPCATWQGLRGGGGLPEFSHVPGGARDRRLFFIHARWADEMALQVHAGLAHTVRFLERVDALLDQPKEVTRTEMIG